MWYGVPDQVAMSSGSPTLASSQGPVAILPFNIP
jgi:hypothetical protein